MNIAAVILAGGRGLRMGGADKGLLEYRKRPLIEWVLESIRPQVDEVMISANRNLDVYAKYACRTLPDTSPDFPGPLAGVLSAMEAVSTEWLLVVPCDTPHLPADLVHGLWNAVQVEGKPIAIAADTLNTHYTTMLVHTGLAESIRAYLDTGQHTVRHWQQPYHPARALFPEYHFENLNSLNDL